MNVDPIQVKEIFLRALKCSNASEREAVLNEACGGDDTLRQQVAILIEAHEHAGSFLEKGAFAGGVTVDQPPLESPETHIGPYRLREELGEGGMGVVFLAEQKEPVERQVALKIIRPGMDTQRIIDRFEAERQALAVMDHPNVAKVLDAGRTNSGRPYFVMELVQGIAITKYCDEHQLSVRERLELFIPVCQAVQHAHQKGIIHRDIKPSNILVAEFDGHPVPKVIDFGVAKAIDQRAAQKQLSTQYGQIVGTLEYMSPEQARLSSHDIDTRSDVYSLGAVLYELLTGITPFDKHTLYSAAFDQALHMIEAEEPLKPSLRLSSSDTLPSVAALRDIEPQRLAGLVRGELDWIVMKALAKERARRYETASGLANDIQRYLNDEPVVACPPSAAYRFRKLARRNKAALTTVAVGAVAILLGIAGTTWQAIRATNQRDRAVSAERLASERYQGELQARRQVEQQRDRAVAAEQRANTEAATAQAVNEFLNHDLLSQADPESQPDRDLRLRTVVDRAVAKIEGHFADQPRVEASVRDTLGQVYLSLGESERARQQFARSSELHDRELGPEHDDTLRSMNLLAGAMCQSGRYAEAETLHGTVLDTQRRVLGAEDPATLSSMANLAMAIDLQGRHAEAEKLCREVLETQQRVLGPQDSAVIKSLNTLAITISKQGRHADAEQVYRQVWEIQRDALGPEHPTTLDARHNLANAISGQRAYPEAERLHREVLEIRRRVLGPEHPRTLLSMQCVAKQILLGQGSHVEAARLLREALEIEQRVLGPEHPATLATMTDLAYAISRPGQYPEAVQLLRNVLEVETRVLGPEHPQTLNSMCNLARTYALQGQSEQAIELLTQLLECWNRQADESPAKAMTQINVSLQRAWLLLTVDRSDDYRQACADILDRFSQSENPEVLCCAAHACVLAPTAVPDPTVPVQLAERAVLSDPREQTLYVLAMAHLRAGQLDQAAQRFQQSLDTAPNWEARFLNWLGLALVHHERGETEASRQRLAKAVELMEQDPVPARQDHKEGQLLQRELEQLLETAEHKKSDSKSAEDK